MLPPSGDGSDLPDVAPVSVKEAVLRVYPDGEARTETLRDQGFSLVVQATGRPAPITAPSPFVARASTISRMWI